MPEAKTKERLTRSQRLDKTTQPSAASAAARPPEVPDWVDETPEDLAYELTIYEDGGTNLQNIEMTREEFINLKHHLAVMRGYPIDKENQRQK